MVISPLYFLVKSEFFKCIFDIISMIILLFTLEKYFIMCRIHFSPLKKVFKTDSFSQKKISDPEWQLTVHFYSTRNEDTTMYRYKSFVFLHIIQKMFVFRQKYRFHIYNNKLSKNNFRKNFHFHLKSFKGR